jgi:hypothetical protein|tara:strand:- start:251 stop:445 length:195 start_codon:yes stop_codon:yes gene_type:complete
MTKKFRKSPWTITLQRTNGNMPPETFVISQQKADKIIEWIQPEIKKKRKMMEAQTVNIERFMID